MWTRVASHFVPGISFKDGTELHLSRALFLVVRYLLRNLEPAVGPERSRADENGNSRQLERLGYLKPIQVGNLT